VPRAITSSRITDIQEPKQQELKDVKEKIKETLVAQKAQEAIMKAANEARTALVDGLKAGEKLEELTKGKEGWTVECCQTLPPATHHRTTPTANKSRQTQATHQLVA